ncbi:MAG: orotate phosphoribosyltransferase [Patescibacteria group bacterium]|nr:orotate phosphoribosyltransferase [Patescibacteria group bacterium]
MSNSNYIAQKTAELLLDIGAITLKPNQPFEFTSGIKSPIYIDNRLTISFPKTRRKIVGFYIQKLKSKIGLDQIELLSGTSTAAIPWAAFVSQQLDLPMIYVRGKKKGHGKENQIEGQIKPGQKTVIIEDHISTGGSLLENLSAVRQKKGEVDYALAITTFLFKEATRKFKENKIKVITLTDYKTIINTAVNKGLINQANKKTVLEWNKNPHSWGF